ncbi:hypothetical protein BDV29DRAFT_178372 [Aspergillus leporis]|uniref:Uncharacterized protein n=1 Tax=Aspergillus leporis TaxID=41062 RepID=A0A5N5WVU0_9EURO|nr:hypothetical protein BDV29DRAFT_178372 [Aspergillus leporis]
MANWKWFQFSLFFFPSSLVNFSQGLCLRIRASGISLAIYVSPLVFLPVVFQ